MYSFPNFEPVCCSMFSSNCCFLICDTYIGFSGGRYTNYISFKVYLYSSYLCFTHKETEVFERSYNLPKLTVLKLEFNTRFKGLQTYALTTNISILLLHLKEKFKLQAVVENAGNRNHLNI